MHDACALDLSRSSSVSTNRIIFLAPTVTQPDRRARLAKITGALDESYEVATLLKVETLLQAVNEAFVVVTCEAFFGNSTFHGV